jgi:autotransporter-associated beta strand protein
VSLPVTIESGAILTLGAGTDPQLVSGPVVDNGSLIIDESSVTKLSGAVSGTGGLVQQGSGRTRLGGVDSFSGGTKLIDGTLELQNSGAAGSGPIDFAAKATATLRIDGMTMPINPIAGFAVGDTIDLAGIVAKSFRYLAGVLRLFNGTRLVAQLNLASPASRLFVLTGDGHGGTDITLRPPVVGLGASNPGQQQAVLAADPAAIWHLPSG